MKWCLLAAFAATALVGCGGGGPLGGQSRAVLSLGHTVDSLSEAIQGGRSLHLRVPGHDYATINKDTSGWTGAFDGARSSGTSILKDEVGGLADDDAKTVIEASCRALDLLDRAQAPTVDTAVYDVARQLPDGLYSHVLAL